MWSVLFILLALLGVLGFLTVKKGGGRVTLQDVLDLIPREMPSLSWPPWGSSQGKYGRVPDSALDDELDLGPTHGGEERVAFGDGPAVGAGRLREPGNGWNLYN